MNEFQIRQRRGALLGSPGVEFGPHRPVDPFVLAAEGLPAVLVRGRVAGERGWNALILDLQRVAGHDPYERHASGQQGWEGDDVVFYDHIRPRPFDDPGQLRLAVPSAADQFLPDWPDPRVELLDRWLAELGGGIAHEFLPELP